MSLRGVLEAHGSRAPLQTWLTPPGSSSILVSQLPHPNEGRTPVAVHDVDMLVSSAPYFGYDGEHVPPQRPRGGRGGLLPPRSPEASRVASRPECTAEGGPTMPWTLSGEMIETCSCNMLCPCWYGVQELM